RRPHAFAPHPHNRLQRGAARRSALRRGRLLGRSRPLSARDARGGERDRARGASRRELGGCDRVLHARAVRQPQEAPQRARRRPDRLPDGVSGRGCRDAALRSRGRDRPSRGGAGVTPSALLPIMAVVLLIAGLTAGFATPLVRRLAMHVGMMDEGGERRMHDQPKPRIGGIAGFLGFAFALFSVLGYLIARHPPRDFEKIHDVIGMLFGATLILMVGIWDDIMGMRPRNKFVAQIVVAGISLLYGFVIKDVENPFARGNYIHFSVPWNYALSLVWYL